MNEYQTLINVAAGAVIAAGGWFCKSVWDAVNTLKAELHQLEVSLPTNYVRREEFSDGLREIKEMLNKISDKLDGKVDK